MPFDRRCVWALIGAMMVAVPLDAGAERPGNVAARPDHERASSPAPSGSTGKTLTGKERLSGKASDEQRIDNCKVPPEKRGPKPRPDSCDHDGIGR